MTRKVKPVVPKGWRAEESHWRVARWVAAVCLLIAGVGIGVAGRTDLPAATPVVAQAMPTVTSTVTATVQAPAQAVIAPEPPAPPPAPPAPATSFGDGVYLVGEQMPPGVYATDGGGAGISNSCYWARLKNEGGSPGKILDNHLGEGPSRFTAKKGEFVEINRCTYTKKG